MSALQAFYTATRRVVANIISPKNSLKLHKIIRSLKACKTRETSREWNDRSESPTTSHEAEMRLGAYSQKKKINKLAKNNLLCSKFGYDGRCSGFY